MKCHMERNEEKSPKVKCRRMKYSITQTLVFNTLINIESVNNNNCISVGLNWYILNLKPDKPLHNQ